VSQRQSELSNFQAILAQYRTNPDVVIQRHWADAMTAFVSHDYVEIFNLPPGTDVAELWITRDLDSQRLADRVRKERENRAAAERRRLDQERERFRTRTDVMSVQE
jgi:hypothetical protein